MNDARLQLAMAVVMVGAWNVQRFDLAFRYNSAWGRMAALSLTLRFYYIMTLVEVAGGCYWVVQIELLREIILHQLT